VVKNCQEKKGSLVVQGIFLAHTKNWANKEFLFVVIHDKFIAHTKMGRYAIFMVCYSWWKFYYEF
jgi:hypothetical protein